MSFLEEQIGLIKNAIDNGIISKDSHLISYHKQLIIYMLDDMFKLAGKTVSISRIEAYVNKAFADELDID
jgi:hypothetical protein